MVESRSGEWWTHEQARLSSERLMKEQEEESQTRAQWAEEEASRKAAAARRQAEKEEEEARQRAEEAEAAAKRAADWASSIEQLAEFNRQNKVGCSIKWHSVRLPDCVEYDWVDPVLDYLLDTKNEFLPFNRWVQRSRVMDLFDEFMARVLTSRSTPPEIVREAAKHYKSNWVWQDP